MIWLIEALYHDPDLPNKQNLFCNGKSTWEVIMESEDFKDGANQPDNTITNPAPSYTIVGKANYHIRFQMLS